MNNFILKRKDIKIQINSKILKILHIKKRQWDI